MTMNDVFKLAMKREIAEPLPLVGRGLDIGAGNMLIPDTIPLSYPDWTWPIDQIPYSDGQVDHIHCYHFMEHLTGPDAIDFLFECQRVLKVGGVFQFCVPYYNSGLQAQDLTHRSAWNEETFRNLFSNSFYGTKHNGKWRFRIHFQAIIGVVERNISLIGQLVKE